MKKFFAYFLILLAICKISSTDLLLFKNNMEPEEEAEAKLRLVEYTKRIFGKDNLSDIFDPPSTIHTRPKRFIDSLRSYMSSVVSGLPQRWSNSVLYGMIARTENDIGRMIRYSGVKGGGCKWTGVAPLCRGIFNCPPEYDYIRSHSGRCHFLSITSECAPDRSFGKPCGFIPGKRNKKNYCCRAVHGKCKWSGHWMAALTGYNFYCKRHRDENCGVFSCLANSDKDHGSVISEISGEDCDMIKVGNRSARATCGYLAWFENNELIDTWYKVDE